MSSILTRGTRFFFCLLPEIHDQALREHDSSSPNSFIVTHGEGVAASLTPVLTDDVPLWVCRSLTGRTRLFVSLFFYNYYIVLPNFFLFSFSSLLITNAIFLSGCSTFSSGSHPLFFHDLRVEPPAPPPSHRGRVKCQSWKRSKHNLYKPPNAVIDCFLETLYEIMDKINMKKHP